ncbi:MAG: DnaA regulatory inactivator Hda [Gammaproteobacteria bacterium]|jgi:DnaA family protein|nr:DnaA regulatory inactivator Hda [Gammaproteobacteria bacterium]
MRQLALELKIADYARFSSFYGGPNAAVLAALQRAATDPEPALHWIWGQPGSGRSHLLQAAIAAAAETRCAWLPLGESAGLDPAMLEGMGNLQLLCLDDVDAVAGDAGWERALFNLCEDVKANRGRLLLSAGVAPRGAGFALPDLTSRLAAGATWRLHPLTDDDLLGALQLRASWRGLELSDEAGRFLLRRVERQASSLFALLDRFDQAALAAAQGRLTVPFIKAVLAQGAG